MITCKICQIEKDPCFFYFRKDSGKYKPNCKECLKAKASDYYYQNRDVVLEKEKVRREQNVEKYKEKDRKYHSKNKELIKQKRKLNSEKVKEWDRNRYQRDKEKRKALVKKIYQNNPTHYKLIAAMRRKRLRQATPKWLTPEHKQQIREIYEKCYELQKTTGQKYHVDHIIPLQGKTVCGLHVPWNLQILTAEENNQKYNKLIEDNINDDNCLVGES